MGGVAAPRAFDFWESCWRSITPIQSLIHRAKESALSPRLRSPLRAPRAAASLVATGGRSLGKNAAAMIFLAACVCWCASALQAPTRTSIAGHPVRRVVDDATNLFVYAVVFGEAAAPGAAAHDALATQLWPSGRAAARAIEALLMGVFSAAASKDSIEFFIRSENISAGILEISWIFE